MTVSRLASTCLVILGIASCRPLPTADLFGYPDAVGDVSSDAAAPLPGCGTGTCDGEESLATCPTDCAAFAVRLASPCTVTGSEDTCARGWLCVDRASSAGGPVCVADFPTWPSYGDKRSTADFAEQGDAIVDAATGLSWARRSLWNLSWRDGMTACTQQTWNGFKDWRAPTRAELRSLLDYGEVNPAAPLAHFDWLAPDLRYWTASPASADPGVGAPDGLAVNFANAKLAGDRADTPHPVRCVRGGAPGSVATPGEFEVRDSGQTVFDRTTGLTWQRAAAPKPLAWPAAQQACAQNTPQLPGVNWRLPTLRELEGLLRVGPTAPNLDAAFATTAEQWAWTATAPIGVPGSMWMQSWVLGPDTSLQSAEYQVRCVR